MNLFTMNVFTVLSAVVSRQASRSQGARCNVGAGGAGSAIARIDLANQLTLAQPEGADYAHQITTGNPGFSNLPTALPNTDFESMQFLTTSKFHELFNQSERVVLTFYYEFLMFKAG
jgi:hypothetical protein